MLPICKKPKPGELNNVDRLSDLPEFIMHHIISCLGRKEACRTCILSKRWSRISDTNPIIEFYHDDFTKGKKNDSNHLGGKKTTPRFLEYIDTRMQRYSNENICIRMLTLEFPTTDEELSSKVDEWIGIAVRNKVVKFVLGGLAKYHLPDILFSAKALTCLDCSKVIIPYYKAVNLVSLKSLLLSYVCVEERMLNHIISSCLSLEELMLSDCSGFGNVVIPRGSKLVKLDLSDTLPIGGTVYLGTSSLKNIWYSADTRHGSTYDQPWPFCPFIPEAGLLRNLSIMTLCHVDITDEALAELVSELTLLETLVFWGCDMLNNIKISSTQLKKICLNNCCSLEDVAIDAPNLTKFKFNGDLEPYLSFTVNSQAKCVTSLHTVPFYLNNEGFFKLKKLLTGLNNCIVLKISLLDALFQPGSDVVEFDEGGFGNVHLGPACNVRELKLVPSSWIPSESSLSAFLNGLLWTCHPDIISVRVQLTNPTLTIQELIRKLEDMAKCWRHPLKSVEVEGANCSSLLKAMKVDLQLRLHW